MALVAASCGDDDAPAPPTAAPAPPQTVVVTSIVEIPGETVTVTSIVTETRIVEVPAETAPPPPARTTISVTTLHLCSETHVGWAVAKGAFADQGIEVNLIETEGAVTGLAAILSGDADIATTNPAAAINAVNEGFPVKNGCRLVQHQSR